MTRKSEIKKQIEVVEKKLKETYDSLNLMVHHHDLVKTGAQEQKKIIDELKGEVSLYSFAFMVTAGRLFAHQSDYPELSPFVEALFAEIRDEYEQNLEC